MKPVNKRKEEIITLVNLWRKRSGLNVKQIVMRMQLAGCDISEVVFTNRFTSRADKEPHISPECILGVVAAFARSPIASERCRADEAIKLANLARLPIDQIGQLKSYFSENEFNQALGRYISSPMNAPLFPPLATILEFKPRVDINRVDSAHLVPVDFSMPLYQNDVIHTYEQAYIIFICETNRLLFQIPEQNTLTVTCENREDKRIIGSLTSLLNQNSSLTEAKSAIQALSFNEFVKSYLLAQLYRERKSLNEAIAQFQLLIGIKDVLSPYLRQHLGDLYFGAAQYTQARENYRTALTAIEAGEDEFARTALHLALARTAYALNEPERALEHLENIATTRHLTLKEDKPAYKGKATLSGYVRFLAKNLTTPRLADEIKTIPSSFFNRLDMLKGNFSLKTDSLAAVSLGQDAKLEAIELLAASYIATRNLLKTLTPLDMERQIESGQFPDTLRHHAERAARDAVGFDTQRARIFANQYAALVSYAPESLQALMK